MKSFLLGCVVVGLAALVGCGDDTGVGASGAGGSGDAECGNSIAEVDEACDSADLNGESCIGLGFTGGTLGCDAQCAFDTSGCEGTTEAECGNGEAEVGEDCDGTDVGEHTCLSEGFDGGELGCLDDCLLDTTGCFIDKPITCGNGAIDADEACEDSDLNGQTCATLGFYAGELSCTSECTFDMSLCTNCGNAVIDPGELCDLTLLNRQTCETLGFDGGELACAENCTFETADCFFETCGNGLIDGAEDCDDVNLDGASCVSEGFTGGMLACNPNCTFDTTACTNDPTFTVGFCRLQFPTSINDQMGSVVTIYGRVYAAGLTDQTTGNDLSPNLVGAVGYGPDGSDPALGGWAWTAAVPNAGWDGTAFGEPNNDEYQAAMTLPASSGSPYDFAYRFSGDGGVTWVYCDGGDAGSSDGYQTANAGSLVTTP